MSTRVIIENVVDMLRRERDVAIDEVEALFAENERLRAALKDIAGYGPFIGGDAWAMRETARRAIHEQTGTEPDQSHDVEQLTR